MYYKHLGDRLFNKFWINFRHKVYIVHNSNKYGGIIKLILFKRGISKIQLSLILLSFLLITFTSAFADLSTNIDITKANMHVTSVTFNKLNISWYPVKVDLIYKVYFYRIPTYIKLIESNRCYVHICFSNIYICGKIGECTCKCYQEKTKKN